MTSSDQFFERVVRRWPAARWAVPMAMLLPPFGFALARPEQALAAMFVLLGFAVWAIAGQARPGWLIGLAACGYAAALLLPDHFSLFSYTIGISAFVLAEEGVWRR